MMYTVSTFSQAHWDDEIESWILGAGSEPVAVIEADYPQQAMQRTMERFGLRTGRGGSEFLPASEAVMAWMGAGHVVHALMLSEEA